jgi:hypothetical protein
MEIEIAQIVRKHTEGVMADVSGTTNYPFYDNCESNPRPHGATEQGANSFALPASKRCA